MKRSRVLLASVILLFFTIFSLHAFSWGSHGFQYSRQTERERHAGTMYETTIDAMGIYNSSFNFGWDAELGYFIHSSLLFPWDATVMTDSSFLHVNFAYADFAAQWNLMTGPAIRQPFSYGSQYYFGLGPDMHLMLIKVDGDSYWDIGLGVGFTMGYLYDFSPYSFMDTGVVVDYQFASYGKGPDDTTWTKAQEYGGYSFRTYIGFGFGGYR